MEKKPTLSAPAPESEEPAPKRPQETPIAAKGRESTCEDPNITKIWKLFFVDNGFDLDYTRKMKKEIDDRTPSVDFCNLDQGGRFALFMSLSGPAPREAEARREHEEKVRVAAWNVRELYELERLFALEYRANPHREYHIARLSHASDTRVVQDTFSSQTDVSLFRAQDVRTLLEEIAMGAGGEGQGPTLQFSDPTAGGNTQRRWDTPINFANAEGLNPQLSVEIRIKPIKGSSGELIKKDHSRAQLSLLDYLYFMIYTVTTTGYGDMAPVSNPAKFIVSIANLFELFFIVLVFNAVAALNRPPTVDEIDAPATEGEGGSPPEPSSEQTEPEAAAT